MDDPKVCWIGFNIVKGIGPSRLSALLAHFGDISNAWYASQRELESSGLSKGLVEAMLEVRNSNELEKICSVVEATGIEILTWDDPNYPRRLKEIDQSPPVLYVKGSLIDDDDWSVAIVGTRRLTSYGRQVAKTHAQALAQNGITVVSGLARGIDAVSHRAALDAGGRTIAVLGSGVDRIYPPEHRNLAAEICDHTTGIPSHGSPDPHLPGPHKI